MKVLTVQEAQGRLPALCEDVLAGEETRLQLPGGALIQLTPVAASPLVAALSDLELTECYQDADWAQFENHCGKTSD